MKVDRQKGGRLEVVKIWRFGVDERMMGGEHPLANNRKRDAGGCNGNGRVFCPFPKELPSGARAHALVRLTRRG